MLANACSPTPAEASRNIDRQVIALSLPSLRPKYFRIFEVVWIKVITKKIKRNLSTFFNLNPI